MQKLSTLNPQTFDSDTFKRVLGLLMILSVLTSACFLLPKTISLMLFPPTEKGNCFFLSNSECISLSKQEIEALFFLNINDEVEILKSQSSHDFYSNRQSAILRVQNGNFDVILSNYSVDVSRSLPPDRAVEAGITTLHQTLVSPTAPRTATTTAFIGKNAQEELLVYLLKEW